MNNGNICRHLKIIHRAPKIWVFLQTHKLVTRWQMLSNKFRNNRRIHYTHPVLQGVRTQTVTSNLDQTERKNAININLKVDSDQGRLGIYAWMITVILTWHLLTSEASFSKTSQKHKIFPK